MYIFDSRGHGPVTIPSPRNFPTEDQGQQFRTGDSDDVIVFPVQPISEEVNT